jgi:hypothetical protein
MKKYFVAVFFLFILNLCSVFYGSEKGQGSFRALILYNPYYSSAHKADASNIKKTFEAIASSLNMPLHLKKVDSRNFSRKKLTQWTKGIHQSKDISFVYYSGNNGLPPDNGPWPAITLGANSSLAVDSLASCINRKHPRLSLVIADCYDDVMEFSTNFRFRFGKPMKKTNDKEVIRNLRKTWLGSSGTLTICSHSLGESGCGMHIARQYTGGVVTEVLLRLLKRGKLSDYPSQLQSSMFTTVGLNMQNIVSQQSIDPKCLITD